MTSEASDEVIRKTVSSIETVAPKAWDLLVQEQRIGGAVDMVRYVCVVLFSAAFGIWVWRMTEKHCEEGSPERIFPRTITCACVFMSLVAASINIPIAYARYSHPEPFAARTLIDSVSRQQQ